MNNNKIFKGLDNIENNVFDFIDSFLDLSDFLDSKLYLKFFDKVDILTDKLSSLPIYNNDITNKQYVELIKLINIWEKDLAYLIKKYNLKIEDD